MASSDRVAFAAGLGGALAAAWLLGTRTRGASAAAGNGNGDTRVDVAYAREMATLLGAKRQAASPAAADTEEQDWPISRQDEVALVDMELRALVPT